ncbi:hypothetical protein Acsp06_50540 [Actinomycetospora sp. NBRC 106375]|uniref:helix-turn-helix transcriptional regulator n=1 Tax=Actinomycetospora sp. NBRC 106375 TaxID=3032207 RepID=UPI0024A4EA1C|nr:helix-turn-helix transcriptional regulator [Actinomycetospora sp. NBRC 106375]GLZ48869.1 hypothetical protein Acsp06_50540 [Actinomycetospora sp. NBRC 106375]
MAIVLDTAQHPPSDRLDLVHEVIGRRGVPTQVVLDRDLPSVGLRMEAWQLGPTHVLRTKGTALRLRRSERDLRGGAPEIFALSLALSESLHTACGVTQHHRAHDCHLNDLTGETDIAQIGPEGGTLIVHVPHSEVGLTVDTVRAALPRLRASPLYSLVAGHLRELNACIDDVAAEPHLARALSATTKDLTRALVVTAAGDVQARGVLHETLRSRIVSYIRCHLTEPDLTATRVAAVHHISLRTLYTVWGSAQEPLMEWIFRQRLHGAARELRDPAARHRTVADVARCWGFVDPRHFRRRFAAVHGMPPGEWRRLP